MSAPRVYKTEAVILKRINLGEADKIVTIYTPHLGKVRAVAKGIRRPASRLGGHLELFTHSTLLLGHGRNLDIITQAETIDSFMPLRDDLWRTSHALYTVELVEQFTEERQENEALYRLLLAALTRLCTARDAEATLRYFEVQLLGLVGYRPELHACVGCRAELRPVQNYFSASAGGVLCVGCEPRERITRPVGVNALKVLRFYQSAAYDEASRVHVRPELMLELESLLREYIRYLIERDLKSVQFLDVLRRREGDGGWGLGVGASPNPSGGGAGP